MGAVCYAWPVLPRRLHHPRSRCLFAAAALLLTAACKPQGTVDPALAQAKQRGAWAIHETLEASIAAGTASEADRQAALADIRTAADDDSAAYAYARASVAGRVAEGRGLKALKLLEEMQQWAKRSIERDPSFEGMAATRLLGTLYVFASQHLPSGDSEEGLELLEAVVAAHPEPAVNRLRLAEGYIVLGDPDPAYAELCLAEAGRAELSGEEAAILAGLIADLGGLEELGCEAGP